MQSKTADMSRLPNTPVYIWPYNPDYQEGVSSPQDNLDSFQSMSANAGRSLRRKYWKTKSGASIEEAKELRTE